MKTYKCTYCGCKEVPYDTQVCPKCNLQPIPPFSEKPLVIKDIIGGLEEEVRQPYPMDNFEDEGHKRLCNREVEVDEDEIGFLLYRRYNHKVSEKTLKEGWTAKHHKSQSKTLCSNLAKAISKAIEQGKVLKVDIGGRE